MQKARTLRKLVEQASRHSSVLLQTSCCDSATSTTCRSFASLPNDYSNMKVVMPTRIGRKADAPVQQTASEGQASVSNAPPSSSPASTLQQGAQAATSWMFPWEKRQMDGRGTPLRTWEKLYWGVFVTAISLFLFNRLRPDPEAAKVDEDKEARKLEAARAVLAGRSFTEGEEDPFEGLGPQEIQAYIDKALQGVSHSDPFEGMSPEEINEYTQKNGVPAQYQ